MAVNRTDKKALATALAAASSQDGVDLAAEQTRNNNAEMQRVQKLIAGSYCSVDQGFIVRSPRTFGVGSRDI